MTDSVHPCLQSSGHHSAGKLQLILDCHISHLYQSNGLVGSVVVMVVVGGGGGGGSILLV
jgi:hypothetical protein